MTLFDRKKETEGVGSEHALSRDFSLKPTRPTASRRPARTRLSPPKIPTTPIFILCLTAAENLIVRFPFPLSPSPWIPKSHLAAKWPRFLHRAHNPINMENCFSFRDQIRPQIGATPLSASLVSKRNGPRTRPFGPKSCAHKVEPRNPLIGDIIPSHDFIPYLIASDHTPSARLQPTSQ